MSKRTWIWMAVTAVGLTVLGACRGGAPQAEAPPEAPASPHGGISTLPAHPPTAAAHPGVEAGGSEVTWSTPSGWKEETPSSAMRRAQYRLPAVAGDGEDGECVVFYFGPGQGGDVRSNIDRWAAQFSGPGGAAPTPKVAETHAGGRTVTKVEVTGTYHPSAMMMTGGPAPAPKPGFMLLGAIVAGGDANWFFKCTGPQKTMSDNRDEFDALIASIGTGA
jgi:hypothetical protein